MSVNEERSKKPHYLPAQPYLALNRAAARVHAGLNTVGIFLVGSCLERPDFRDVDVRAMMYDGAYDELFPRGPDGTESDAFWSLLCESIGAYLAHATGLPNDFQIQRMTEANATYPGPRNALTSAGGRRYPGKLPSDVRARGKLPAALLAALASARADVASGRPATAWGDFTEYAVEDEEKDGA